MQQIDDAKATLRQGLKFPFIAKRAAILDAQTGNFNEAVEDALKLDLSVREWGYLASLTSKNKKYKLSTICLKEALKIDNSDPRILNNFAWYSWLSTKNATEEALIAAKKANTKMPDNIAILNTYALLLFHSANYKDCIELLRLKSTHNNVDARILYWLAKSREKSGSTKQAKQNYIDALRNQSKAGKWVIEISRAELKNKISQL